MAELRSPVDAVLGPTQSKRLRQLERLGVHTVCDLLFHFPREYADRRLETAVTDLRPEQEAVVRARVVSITGRTIHGRRRRHLVQAVVEDDGGRLRIEFWQQRFRLRQLEVDQVALFAGRVTADDRGLLLSGPDVETAVDEDGERLHAGRIVPVHPLTKGLPAATVRSLVWRALAEVELTEPLPEELRARRELLDFPTALRAIHFPKDPDELRRARDRLEYDELFHLQLGLALRRRIHRHEVKPHRFRVDERLERRILARYPFELTAAQRRVTQEIRADLLSEHPMNRLLQGDVGAGKTAVALYAMLVAVAHRMQATLLAPTEILAEQHLRTLQAFLQGSDVRLELISGGGRAAAKREARRRVAEGEVDIAVGTHALFQRGTEFHSLGLVVVDEQHKFGVLQRAELRAKGIVPDLLVMSATPIPRTLTMTLFGDLDVSVLDELPPGRQPVETLVCRETDRPTVEAWVRSEVEAGRRAYWVAPLVEESDDVPATAAVELRERLARDVYPDLDVGLLHGRMTPAEKDAAMAAFQSGATPILVATTVIEVGVDVREATAMVIESAERFGLAQLHQLRGRVGRGSDPSRVVLFAATHGKTARARLRAISSTTDGFRIAEEDLAIRGPGEFLGTRQHGLPELKLASLVSSSRRMAEARDDARELVEHNPRLERDALGLRDMLRLRFGAQLRTLLS